MENQGRPYKLYLAAFAANITLFVSGNCMGFTSPTIPIFLDENNDIGFTATVEEVSWVVSLLTVGAIIGPIFAGLLASKLGRKCTLLAAGAIFIFGYVFLIIGKSMYPILVGRFLHGLAVGFTFTIFPMYISEVSSDDLRGTLASLLNFFLCFGLTMTFVFGQFMDYHQLVLTLIMFPIFFCVLFIFMPETPQFYLSIKRDDKALKALRFLRAGPDDAVVAELAKIKASYEASMLQSGSFKDIFSNKVNVKAILLGFTLVMILQFCGVNVITFYMETIFRKAKVEVDPGICAIVMGFVQLVASCSAPLFLLDRVGRKTLLIVSCFGMATCTALMGVCFYLDHIQSPIFNKILWMPIVIMILFMILFSVGVGPLIWTVVAELYAPNIRAIGMTLTASYCWAVAFVLSKYFPTIEDAVGTYSAFWMFSICTVLLTLIIIWKLPETKDKTLEQIQKELAGEPHTAV